MESPPLVSIIVLNLNGKEFLEGCLHSILTAKYPNFEVCLIDNGSTDGSVDYVEEVFGKELRLKIIRSNRNLGYAGGNNLGVQQAKGEYIVFLNNDTIVDPYWLDEIVAVLTRESSIGACQSKLLLADDRQTIDTAGSLLSQYGFLVHRGINERDRGQFDKVESIFVAKGAALTLTRHAIERAGLFDPAFFVYLEEADLCWRVWLTGLRVVYVPKSVVFHSWGQTLIKVGSSARRQILRFHGTKNYIRMLIKNLGFRNMCRIIPIHVTCWLAMAVYYALKGYKDESRLLLKGIWWNLTHLQDTCSARAKVQRLIRKVSDG